MNDAATGPMANADTTGDAGVMLVTGGSRGIGAATCRLAAERGFDVAVNYATNRDAADDVVADCEAHGVRAIAIAAAVEDDDAVTAMFDRVDEQLGRLTVLVNNAGVLETHMRVDEMTADRWRRVFDVNVVGSFNCAKQAALRMSTRHGGVGGSIVNVSSVAASLGSPFEYVDYAASKAAVDTMTIGLGRELAEEGVRVNAIRPGVVYTEIHASGGEPERVDRVKGAVPMRRGGQPEEIARSILWLASDEASYVTATTLDVSGGR